MTNRNLSAESLRLVTDARIAFEEAKTQGALPTKEFMDKCASEIGVEFAKTGEPPVPTITSSWFVGIAFQLLKRLATRSRTRV